VVSAPSVPGVPSAVGGWVDGWVEGSVGVALDGLTGSPEDAVDGGAVVDDGDSSDPPVAASAAGALSPRCPMMPASSTSTTSPTSANDNGDLRRDRRSGLTTPL